MAWPQVRRVTLLAIAGLLALPTLRYLPPFLDCPPALTPPARALRPPAAPSPPPSAPGPAPGPWLTLPWAEAFGTRTCDNALFCYIAPDVTLVVADAVALSPHAVLLLGLYRVPGHGGVAPALRCAAPGAGATHARAYTTTVFTEEKRFKTYTWRGVPFSYFDALCEWPDPVLRPGAITVLTVSGTHNISRIPVQGPPADWASPPPPGITACVSQFHSQPEPRLVLEFIEYYRLLGVRRFVVYDFGDGGHSAADLRALYAGVDAELVLVDWAPVQRYPTWLRGQVLALNHCWRRSRAHSSHVLNIDIDEYVFPPARGPQALPRALAAAVAEWSAAAASAASSPLIILASFDFDSACLSLPPDANPLRLTAPQLQLRAAHPDHYSDGARAKWRFYFADGAPRDGVGGGRVKWIAPTAVGPALHASVHTFFGDYAGVQVVLPEVTEWRVNHYRNLLRDRRCVVQVRDYRETHATHKHVYHPPAEPSKEVNKVVKAVEDSGMGQALPVLTRSVRQTPAVAAFLSAAVNGSLARGAPRT